jgi:hypothetical protein
VLVAAAYGGQKNMSHFDKVRGHGEYLPAHLRVTADGRTLEGRVVGVPEQASGRPTYELEYRLTGGAYAQAPHLAPRRAARV